MQKQARLAQVVNIIDLSPHLRRIVLSGEALKTLPEQQTHLGINGTYVKVLLPEPGANQANLSLSGKNAAIKRSYTIQEYNPVKNELALDFVIRCHQGPATNWALTAKIGDQLGIAGPGPRKLTNLDAPSYLLIGDLTSVNAIIHYLKMIPKQADCFAFITVPSAADIIPTDELNQLHHPIHWLIENEVDQYHNDLLNHLDKIDNLDQNTEVLLAAEAQQVRVIKNYLLDERKVSRSKLHASAYWKKGIDADGLSIEKRQEDA